MDNIKQTSRFLYDTNATIHCEYDYPIKALYNMVSNPSSIIRDNPTQEEIQSDNELKQKMYKASLLGCEMIPYDIPKTSIKLRHTSRQ